MGTKGQESRDNRGRRPWGEPGNRGFHHEKATETHRWKQGAVTLLGASQVL